MFILKLDISLFNYPRPSFYAPCQVEFRLSASERIKTLALSSTAPVSLLEDFSSLSHEGHIDLLPQSAPPASTPFITSPAAASACYSIHLNQVPTERVPPDTCPSRVKTISSRLPLKPSSYRAESILSQVPPDPSGSRAGSISSPVHLEPSPSRTKFAWDQVHDKPSLSRHESL